MCYNLGIMSPEKFSAAETREREVFDDSGAKEIVLKGLARVLADEPKPDTVSGEESIAKEDVETEEEDEEDYEFGSDDEEEDYEFDDYEDNYEDDTKDEKEDYEDSDSYEVEDNWDKRTEELEREKQFEVLTIPKEVLEEYKLPEDLPTGVAVMGGTARSLARRLLTGDEEPTRDLDLVYIPEFAGSGDLVGREKLDEIATKYMPDDFAFGHTIKRENLEEYFGSRDFTINQCLVVGDKLMLTRAAYDDFQENIIRPSYYTKPNENDELSDRILMRALLLKSVLEGCTSSYPTIEELDEANYAAYYDIEIDDDGEEWSNGELYPMRDFQIALTLNKAMSRGVREAMRFTETLVDYNIVDKKYMDQPMKLAQDIIARNKSDFKFRPVDSGIDDEDFDAEAVLTVSPMKQSVRQKLREYKSREPRKWSEPMLGRYTETDYERVNSGRG